MNEDEALRRETARYLDDLDDAEQEKLGKESEFWAESFEEIMGVLTMVFEKNPETLRTVVKVLQRERLGAWSQQTLKEILGMVDELEDL